jgi:Co/Zn/Cd efflux system component
LAETRLCDWLKYCGDPRPQVLAGFANGVFLVFVSLLIVLESIERIMEPQETYTLNP